MEKLRILHFVAWFPSKENPVEGIFIKEHIRAIGRFTRSKVIYGRKIEGYSGIKFERDSFDDIEVFSFRYGNFLVKGISFLLYVLGNHEAYLSLKKEGFEPDIIHVHVYRAGIPAVFIGMAENIPVVVTEHFSIFTRGNMGKRERLRAELTFKNSSHITAVSNYLAGFIRNYAGDIPITVIPNVVDHSIFFPARRKKKKKSISFITVAHLELAKGIQYLIRAAHILKLKGMDFTIRIVGEGSKRGEFSKMIRELGVADRVFLLGRKSHREVAELMRNSDVLVHPSLGETFGVVIVEAMASGLPVIATDCGGPAEIVDEESGIIVPPADEKALAEAMEKFIEGKVKFDREKIHRKSLGFSYENVGKQFIEVYNRVLERRQK